MKGKSFGRTDDLFERFEMIKDASLGGLMKKVVSFVLSIFIVILSLVGCNHKVYHWEFEQSVQNVKEIKIIEVEDEFNYVVIKELDTEFIKELYDDIQKIEMKRYGTNLSHPSGKSFLIVFENGEYDIISKTEPKHFRYDGDKLMAYNSWLKCDSAQFDERINQYLNS